MKEMLSIAECKRNIYIQYINLRALTLILYKKRKLLRITDYNTEIQHHRKL